VPRRPKKENEEFASLCGWLKASPGAWISFTEVQIYRNIILKFFCKKLRLNPDSDSAKSLESDLTKLFPEHY
jgi:hypothetical protein